MIDNSATQRRTLPALLFAGFLASYAHPVSAQTIVVNSGSATVSGTGTTVVGVGTTLGGADFTTNSYTTGTAAGQDIHGPSTLNLEDGGSIQSITANFGGGRKHLWRVCRYRQGRTVWHN